MNKYVVYNFLLLAGLLVLAVAYSHRVDAKQLVFNVCNESRISPTIDERGCADLQEQLNMEFLCDGNNTNVNTHCWVEVK